jgi:hypothetical protein
MMESVKVPKAALREKVQTNRDSHRAEFEKALEGYRLASINVLERNLALLKAGSSEQVVFDEQRPQDHTADYDRVLRMLDMSVEEAVELSSEAFDQYVLNNWHWRRDWLLSNAAYTQAAR